MKVKIYRFTDLRTGETFTGTSAEYRKQTGMAEVTLSVRINKHKDIKRELVDVKEIVKKPRNLVKEWTNIKTGQTFIGTRLEAMDFFKLTPYLLRRARDKGMIHARTIKKSELKNLKMTEEEKAEQERIRKLRRKSKREYYLRLAQEIESQNQF